MADDLNWLSAAELLKGYRKKKFSPVEVVTACLAQIAQARQIHQRHVPR